jgi:tetratricopeptide (TPR) repeat protein
MSTNHNPQEAKKLHQLALSLYQKGNHAQAANHLVGAIQKDHRNATLYADLAACQNSLGLFEDAEKNCQKCLKINPHLIQAYQNLGAARLSLKKTDDAKKTFCDLLNVDPNNAQAFFGLGMVAAHEKKQDEAIQYFEKAVRLQPEWFVALAQLGKIHLDQKNFEKAVQTYNRALEMNPRYVTGYVNLGCAYLRLDRFEASCAASYRAIDIKPDCAPAYINLANAASAMNRVDECMGHARKAIECDPQFAEAHYELALKLLLKGDLIKGWEEYEWRLKLPQSFVPQFLEPVWDGRPFQNKTLLIHCEQGFGDTLQFIRYVLMVKPLGGKVIVKCQPALIPLLQSIEEIDELIPYYKASTAFDFYVPLLSLPKIFKTNLENIPSYPAYISIDPEKINKWAKRLSQIKGCKVGICWQGNPKHQLDKRRSVTLEQFINLADIKNSQLISLQKGFSQDDLNKVDGGASVLSYGELIDNFVDTAGLIMNCDLIISVDTAIVHLSAALGKPTWCLLHVPSDWRWVESAWDHSPWYPTMRLFRQSEPFEWGSVMKNVREKLEARF